MATPKMTVPEHPPAHNKWPVQLKHVLKKPVANPDKVNPSKYDEDQVEWKAPKGEGVFTVVFEPPMGTPFENGGTFTVPDGGSTLSGFLKDSVVPGEDYKYSVIDDKGEKTDPDVIIRP